MAPAEDIGHHMHNGPFVGQWIPTELIPRVARDAGIWPVVVGRYRGRYIRDQQSAGGRDWDWHDA